MSLTFNQLLPQFASSVRATGKKKRFSPLCMATQIYCRKNVVDHDTILQTPLHGTKSTTVLDSRFHSVNSRLWIPRQWNLDSGFRQQKFPGFRSPHAEISQSVETTIVSFSNTTYCVHVRDSNVWFGGWFDSIQKLLMFTTCCRQSLK